MDPRQPIPPQGPAMPPAQTPPQQPQSWGPPAVAPEEKVWRFVVQGKQEGPVDKLSLEAMIRGRSLHPETLVWRPGMADWESADLLPEFDALFRQLGPEVYGTAQQVAAEKRGRNTTTNCVTMFVIFVLTLLAVVPAAVGDLRGDAEDVVEGLAYFMGVIALAVSIFAVIYVPIAWKSIRSRPAWVQVLGFVGAAGLVVTTVVALVMTVKT